MLEAAVYFMLRLQKLKHAAIRRNEDGKYY